MTYKVDLDTVGRFNQASQLNERGGDITRRWQHIDTSLRIYLPYVGLLRELTRGDWLQQYQAKNATIARFINDTIGFVLGEKRLIGVTVWDDIIRDAIESSKFTPSRRLGNIGTAILDAYTNPSTSAMDAAVTNQVKPMIRKDLNVISDRDLAMMWICRPNGIDDLITSITVLAQIMNDMGPMQVQ